MYISVNSWARCHFQRCSDIGLLLVLCNVLKYLRGCRKVKESKQIGGSSYNILPITKLPFHLWRSGWVLLQLRSTINTFFISYDLCFPQFSTPTNANPLATCPIRQTFRYITFGRPIDWISAHRPIIAGRIWYINSWWSLLCNSKLSVIKLLKFTTSVWETPSSCQYIKSAWQQQIRVFSELIFLSKIWNFNLRESGAQIDLCSSVSTATSKLYYVQHTHNIHITCNDVGLYTSIT